MNTFIITRFINRLTNRLQSVSTSLFVNMFSAVLISCVMASSAQAMEAPDLVVKRTIDDVVVKIQTNRSEYRADPNKLYAMMEDTFIPAIHVDRMALLILGNGGRSATAEQKAAFTHEFKTFLIRSYATALLDYTSENQVIYTPTIIEAGEDRVDVNAEFVGSDGQKYPFTLQMSNRSDTSWRAYNIEVAGINFVATYRATFSGIIAQKGIDGLINDLKEKNAKLAS